MKVAKRNGNSLEIMARLGYGSRGLVYALVGGLALLAALGSGGQTGGSRSALQSLLGQPFGKVLLGLIAAGLASFALWRLIEAITDADHRGSSGKALAVRVARGLSGMIYIGLAFSALSLAVGWGTKSGGEDRAAQDWTAWLLAKPFGQWGVALVGLAIAGTGLAYLWRAWQGNVTEQLSCPSDARRWVVSLGRFGFGGRGIVFVLIGGFLVLAAWHSNSREVKGLGGALRALQEQPYGWALLGLTAAGLLSFGLFGFAQALYRRINAPDLDEAGEAVANGMQSLRSNA
jgi:hypothetical protein